VKYADFSSLTRRRTLATPTDDGQTLYRESLALLAKVDVERPIRLTGVSAQDLVGADPQLGLFPIAAPRHQQLNAAVDRITAKFGATAVVTADLMNRNAFALRDGFYAEEKQARSLAARDPTPDASSVE
jgi:DNA polymerase-4